jgi:MFS family permease
MARAGGRGQARGVRRLVPWLPRAAWQILAAGGLSAVANGLTYPFLVVYLHRVRDLSLGTAGLAAATIAAAAILVNLVAGPLIDRLGPRRVVGAMVLVGACGAGTLAFADTAPLALLGSALYGAGLTTGWVGLQQVIVAVVRPEQRADAFAVQFALLNAGIGAGGLTAGLLVDFDRPASFQAMFLAAAACYAIFAAVLPLVALPPRPVATAGFRRGGGYREVFRDRRFRLVFALNFVFVGIGVGQLESAFPAFATEVGGASPRVLGLAFAADTAVIVLFQFWVTARLRGRRRTRGLMLESVFWAAAWGTALGAGWLDRPYLFVAVAVLFACAEMLHSPTIPAIVNDLAPDRLRGRYNAAGALSWQSARVIGATTSGQLLGYGLGGPLLAGFIGLCGVGALLALRLERILPPEANGMRLAHGTPSTIRSEHDRRKTPADLSRGGAAGDDLGRGAGALDDAAGGLAADRGAGA